MALSGSDLRYRNCSTFGTPRVVKVCRGPKVVAAKIRGESPGKVVGFRAGQEFLDLLIGEVIHFRPSQIGSP